MFYYVCRTLLVMFFFNNIFPDFEKAHDFLDAMLEKM